MSGRLKIDRARERAMIRADVAAITERSIADDAGADHLALCALELMGEIVHAVCNLAETVDAQGDAIRAAVRGNTSAIERAADE